MNLSKLLSFEQGRITFFETLTKHPENWQQNPTPLSIVRKMLDKTLLEDKKILVLFNLEFLQVLVEERKVKPENIYYIADNELEFLGAIKIFKVHSYKLNDFSVSALKKLIVGIDMKFDLVFSNPPYNNNIDIKILNEIIDVADEFVVIHPSTWVIDIKGKLKLYKDFKTKIASKLKDVEFFNGNAIFDIQLFVPICITHIQKNSSEIDVKYFDDLYVSKSIDNITKFGSSFETLILPFMNMMQTHINIHSQMIDYNLLDKLDENSKYVQLAQIRGTPNRNKTSSKMLLDDFYTLVMKNSGENIGIRKTSRTPTFRFENEIECLNFVNYLKTDFARFCLAIYKDKATLDCGEMELIPWLDFTEEWDDEKLFEKFDVSQELQDYIRDFLPDFHGIRK